MAVGPEGKFAPVPGQYTTYTPCQVNWLVSPPTKENGHKVSTMQKIRYFGVIEVKPIPNLPNFQNLSAIATIHKVGELAPTPKEEFSYDATNPRFHFNAIPCDIQPSTQDSCRYILLRHVHFPLPGIYKLQITVKAMCVAEVNGQSEFTHHDIDRMFEFHVEVEDGVTWDEERKDEPSREVLAHLERYRVMGCAGYKDKQTHEWVPQNPMYCKNPRRRG
ncbi:hypothetical protein QBC32DRAFT_384411 [Pseudoneurospora amorphoporcata]|uniref:Uncharacterized protein n=1 Tax=Pseudoneurospora amorphoporcata TaxID=241081 RepID=A0AAN6P0I7_9PEZI|nr:hypothetical protein QBC32DRAFT_384411 [Pseudoneurospora amorphoporcata]